jgi:hypothetical protein
MRKMTWQLVLATFLALVAVGDRDPAWAGDTQILEQHAAAAGLSLEEYLRSMADHQDEAPRLLPPPPRHAVGALQQVQLAAEVMTDPAVARDWGWEGRLTAEDLTNDYATFGSDGQLRAFNVLDAEGFFERFKCNLFVFELAYRAGLLVPVMSRTRGWGYIGPPEVLRQIERGSFDRGWAALADDREIDDLRAATRLGIPFVLIAEGRDGRAGHMGMVDQFHVVERNEEGQIHRIVYSGWEANGDEASYQRRTWGLWRFERIHILELQEPRSGQAQVFPIDAGPPLASDLDARRVIADATPVVAAQRSASALSGLAERPVVARSIRANGALRGPARWVRGLLPRSWLALASARSDLFRVLGLGDLVRGLADPRPARHREGPVRPVPATLASGGDRPLLSSR